MIRSRRFVLVAGGLALLLLLLALGVRMALQPARVTATILDRTGRALGLEITATGIGEYRLRGLPMLVVRDVVVRQPGATTPLLRAERILLSVPWSTIRARGAELNATRIELDAPHLDVPALQRWLATRPPAERRTPTLTRGLAVTRGRIDNGSWRIEDLDARLPEFAPGRPVAAQVRGRYVDAATRIPFELAVALTRPDGDAGLAVIGPLTIERDRWRMPARIRLSGPLRVGDGALRIVPMRLALSARYESGETRLPFALGLTGPLRFQNATWSVAPAGIALRGDGVVPDFDARGALALGRRVVLHLDGTLATWPEAWPALPPPIGQSRSPLPFALDYVGRSDFGDIARLRLQRDATRFDGRFRLPELTVWVDAADSGSPLPPLDGRASTPRLEISGAQLEGVDVTLDDPRIPGDPAAQ